MQKTRQEVAHEDCWNVESFFPTLKDWENAFQKCESESKDHTWPSLQAFKGSLNQGAPQLKKALETLFSLSRELSKLYTYAHLRHDEDIALEEPKAAYQRAIGLYTDFGTQAAWFNPELLSLTESTQKAYLNDPLLQEYRFQLEDIFRLKEHTLTADKEELVALSAKALQTPYKAFSAINDADFSFGEVLDSKGEKSTLTHATYGIYQRSHDRTLRKNSFLALHGKYRDYSNTLTELLNGISQGHYFQAKARNYPTCLDAALYPLNIDTSVYHSLIAAVRNNLDALHQYVALRKKLLGLSEIHLYDMYVPLCGEVEMKIPYLEAEDLVIESVAPLGPEYQNILRKGLKEQRWVDRFENKSKRSGAYSSGCYDSQPYILMNYKEILRDVFTLAHEAGHSMHSYMSHKHQPYHYGDYAIFVAEVASTFNEQLLAKVLIEKAKTKEEKFYLINSKVEDIRGTIFRQTMFAEFELFIHDCVEKNIPLTPASLREKYRALNRDYFGTAVTLDEEATFEWARIPHFYYNFYVYQYATGLSASLALYKKVINGGVAEREAYLGFLKAGSSDYPINILEKAGVNMRKPDAVADAIGYFRELIGQLEVLAPSK